MTPSIASLYQAVELRQQIPPLIVGERCNANGSRRFRECLLAEDFEGCLRLALEQEREGAHVIDLCTAYAGRDECRDLTELVVRCARELRVPLMIDSTTPACIEACLELYPGRCLVNSVNLEDGGANLRRICRAAKRHGAAVVALTIDESGMAMQAEEKVRVARRIHDLAVAECGLRSRDLLFDCLTFTVGAGDETLRDAAAQTLAAIRRLRAELPGVFTILGVSNISFGLAPHARRILNSVFLHEAVEAGLDAAIVDAGKVLPLSRIGEDDRVVCLDLLYDRGQGRPDPPLMRFIAHFRSRGEGDADGPGKKEARHAEEALFQRVVDGDREGLEDLLRMLLGRHRPVDIINRILVPAMRHVGELFGRGEILLPFVLKSAETMRASVRTLEPFLERQEGGSRTSILLATVQGDVHDIGKNLVEIILANNGYTVHNLGIKVPAEVIVRKARELDVDLIGLSGLLVKSALVMAEDLAQFEAVGLSQPVLLGGAALTPRFVAESCAPHYSRPVVYCADAFAGLKAVREFEAGTLTSTRYDPESTTRRATPGLRNLDIDRRVAPPRPPFLGCRHIDAVPLEGVLALVNREALYRGRWGYRRGRLGAEEYEGMVRGEVEPIYEDLCRRAGAGLVRPRVAYGYFRCWSEGDRVCVEHAAGVDAFAFPRQGDPPHLCIADFFRGAEDGGDVAGFLVVTIGEDIGRETARLYAEDRYHDYLMLHGFGVEVTDALAEYWHAVMRREMGIAEGEPEGLQGFVTQGYRGARYGFGYPACPDLDAQRLVFDLLHPEVIGVSLTETMQMVPEQSTSAIVAHHPQAKYFAV
ncbi:MAG: dihydropteroate synthase [Lentisphaeria bacterium]|nr:dihydropteroate synthase [Lentisphaeria bacterium]